MTREESQLLELTARSLLKLEQDVRDRLAGIEAVLQALFVCRGNTDLALARRRVQIDLLQTKGTPSTYLKSFVEGVSRNDVSFGGTDGSQQTDRRQRTKRRSEEALPAQDHLRRVRLDIAVKKPGTKKAAKKFKGVRREK
jgi:hypothetical protein